jgi:hypothetical protein
MTNKTKPSATRLEEPVSPIWCVGKVRACDDDVFDIDYGALQGRARRAASCLLEPAPGDTVACLRVAAKELWVLAVLHRDAAQMQLLRMRGDTRIEVEGGTLQLQAPHIGIEGRQLQLSAHEAKMAVDSAELVGRHLRVTGSVLKLVGSVLSSVMDRVNHYSRHYLRTTDGIDRVAATHVECEARQLLRLSGEHALVNGEKLVKARGGQIHFG